MSTDWKRQRLLAVVVCIASLAVFLLANGRANLRCKGNCYGSPPLSRYGSITYEPGHPWTRYADSWQWSAQSALGDVALLAAVVGLGLAATRFRSPVIALIVSVVAALAWALWVAASPSTGA
jgi:hypothetical protein